LLRVGVCCKSFSSYSLLKEFKDYNYIGGDNAVFGVSAKDILWCMCSVFSLNCKKTKKKKKKKKRKRKREKKKKRTECRFNYGSAQINLSLFCECHAFVGCSAPIISD
jgi:hypothetical protein